MESFPVFMSEKYVVSPDNRLTVKSIYEDFRDWVISKSGVSIWNSIGQKQVYTALKNSAQYAYVRFREGYCLKGIAYKTTTEVAPVVTKTIVLKLVNNKEMKWKGPPQMVQNVLPRAFQINPGS